MAKALLTSDGEGEHSMLPIPLAGPLITATPIHPEALHTRA